MQNVCAEDALGTQRGAVGNGLKGNGRTQIGEASAGVAQGEQAGLGTQARRKRIKLRTTDGAEQHGAGGKATLPGLGRERRAELDRGSATNGRLFKAEIVTTEVGDRTQDTHSFARNLRPNSIPGKNSYVQFHCVTSPPNYCCAAIRFGDLPSGPRWVRTIEIKS